MISIEGVSKKYGQLKAVNDLNLEIPKGELFAFLGPNGAGKTTTIKMICGLLRPTDGRLVLAGHDVQHDPVQAVSRIGYIPDHPYLYEKLTGQELLDFVCDLHRINRSIRARRVQQLLEMFSLAPWRHRLVQEYSHGMRQKLVFAAALIHEPEILIVDEPMVGLDPKSAKLIKDLFQELTRRGVTVFLSTHTLSVAEEVADRIGLIQGGNLFFLGSIQEMKTSAKSDGNLEELFLQLTQEETKGETSAAYWLDQIQE